MRKHLLLLAAMLCSMAAFAQWTKPMPERTALVADETLYLFNEDYDGFLVGANDWVTRASLSKTAGYQVKMVKYEHDGAWDGQSYVLTDFAETKSEWRFMDFGNCESIWIDREMDNTTNYRVIALLPQGENVYEIGMSDGNKDFQTEENKHEGDFNGLVPCEENFPGARLALSLQRGNTRLYWVHEDNTELYGALDAVYKRWCFVTPATYGAYLVAMEQYNAAMSLGKSLEEAKAQFPGADLTSIEAIYKNTNSTAQQLRQAEADLRGILAAISTPENGANMTNCLTNAAYNDNSNTGWEGATPGFQVYGNAEFYNCNYNYYQTITGLPNGVYRVGVTAYYRAGNAEPDAEALQNADASKQLAKLYATTAAHTSMVSLPFASTGATEERLPGSSDCLQNAFGYIPNNMETAAVYMEAGQYKPTYVTCLVTDGTLTIGLRKDATIGGDWTLFDNWTIHYLGDSQESYAYLTQETLAGAVDYQSLVADELLLYYQHSAYNDYVSAIEAMKNATSAADLGAALNKFNTSIETLATSIDAYAKFAELYMAAKEWLNNLVNETETSAKLADYIYDDGGQGYNGNGGAAYILSEGPLTAEQVLAEIAYLQELYNDALANSMSDGDDCTDLLKNPRFAEEGGWTATVGSSFPHEGNPLFEGWNKVFDVYQELEGLQNGLYELSYNGLFRPASAGAFVAEDINRSKAYAYINNYETKFPSILDDLSQEPLSGDDVDYLNMGYGPNTGSGASAALNSGRYPAKAYGLVTDGKMKVGFKNNLRVEDGCVGWIANVRLTFRGKNAQVLGEVIAATIAEAQGLQDNVYCGNPETEALNAAIAACDEVDESGLYNALIDLKAAIEAIHVSVTAYEGLKTALFSLDQAITGNTTADATTLAAAEKLFAEAMDAYNRKHYGAAEAEQAASDLNAMTVALKMGTGVASEENPVDYTEAIINNNFDPSRGSKDNGTIEGWTTTAMNGYKQFTVSYNRAAIELSQKLSGLPAGKYKVTVHTYYRAGYYNEEEDRISRGEETHLTTLYAQTSEERFATPVMNLCEGATDEKMAEGNCYTLSNGKYAPDGTTPTVEYFAKGYYQNELRFTVPADGEVTIGLSKTEILDNDYQVVGEWHLWYMGEEGQGGDEVRDVSDLIVNNDFDPARGSKDNGTIEGWTTSAMNGYKQNTASYNRAAIDLYQDLSGLPTGTYEVTVHTYYRAGYHDEEWNYKETGTETHLTTLYAETSSERYAKPVMNLYEDAVQESEIPEGVNCYSYASYDGGHVGMASGYINMTPEMAAMFVPNGTSPTVAFFNAGYYLNRLPFYVTDGKVRIGLSKTEVLPNDYQVVGRWNLYYHGASNKVDELNGNQDDAIHTTRPADLRPIEFYTLDGLRLPRPQRGLNIVRMPDGTVRKVLVK